jgi:ATP-dependent helicase/nuclease subunit A
MKIDLSTWSPEQQQAIVTRGQNVLVSAGAGSGKTSVLVERVVQCVVGDNATDLQRLLVVTFTEAAAAEMRRRITERLQRLYQDAVNSGDEAFAERVARQLEQVDLAQISTLHSFCMQVVRRNFLYLGIEPVFSLMSEDDGVLLRSEVLNELLETALAGPGGDALASVITKYCAGQPSRFEQLVTRLYQFAVSQPDPLNWLQSMAKRFVEAAAQPFLQLPWTPAFLSWCRRHVLAARAQFLAARQLAEGAEELAAYAENLALLVDACEAAERALSAGQDVSMVASLLRSALDQKTPRAKDHPDREAVKARRTKGIQYLQKVLPVLERGELELQADVRRVAPDVAALAEFVATFLQRYQAAKLARNWLDFNDLEHFALKALQDPKSGEALRLQEWFVEVFVDEYQDTSPIQDAIVAKITRPQGNTFVVGDVKQSIYRFRMAEPNLFLHRYRYLDGAGRGSVIDLTNNYRSRREVVDAVNFMFAQLLSESFGGIAYDERARMVAKADYPTGVAGSLEGPVEVHLISRDTPEEPSDEGADDSGPLEEPNGYSAGTDEADELDLTAIEKEARVIGRRILELVGRVPGAEPRQVWDPKRRQFRPIQYRDIVVLMRSVRTRMNAVLEVFRQLGIPAYGATSTGFYGALEVQWLLAALSAVDNPRREIDFVALLRSPLARFRDDELALIRLVRSGNFYDAWTSVCRLSLAELQERWPTSPEETARVFRKVHAFMKRFTAWRAKARQGGAEDVLRTIIEETSFEQYLSGMPGGDVRRANLYALLDKARAFDRSSTDGVYGFVQFASAVLEHEVDTGEARTLGENEDVVRVLTIHQSKGLEYPVVFVADLGKMFYRDPAEVSFPLHREYGFGPQCVDPKTDQKWPTVASIAIEESERKEFLAEEARVLYVALTRAREKLILVGSARKLESRIQQAAMRASDPGQQLPLDVMMEARSCLDWILPALCRHRDGAALRQLAEQGDGAAVHPGPFWDHPARFQIHLWNLPGAPSVPSPDDGTEFKGRRRFTSLGEVLAYLREQAGAASAANASRNLEAPAGTPEHSESAERCDSADRFDPLAHAESTESLAKAEPAQEPRWPRPSKVSATDLRRLWVARAAEQTPRRERLFPGAAERLLEDPRFVQPDELPATDSGTAFHAVMQHLDLRTPPLASAVEAEIERLVKARKVREEHARAVDVDDVVAFLDSSIGRRVAAARRVLREQPFFQRIDVPVGSAGRPTFAVAQGVIDCLAEEADGWLLIDFKTDNIRAEHTEWKAREYAAQIAVYLDAATAAVGDKPVTAYLYFVKPRVFVPMDRLDLSVLFS